jgi:hypothetical protein
MAKTKMTGFARLLIFLLVFLPLAFFGASYINGEDPIAKVKEYLGGATGETSPRTEQTTTGNRTSDLEKRIETLKTDLAIAEEKLARCQLENQ